MINRGLVLQNGGAEASHLSMAMTHIDTNAPGLRSWHQDRAKRAVSLPSIS
jgi:hypothetical protein